MPLLCLFVVYNIPARWVGFSIDIEGSRRKRLGWENS
jgi:hypothetical protein